ncbi:MAG TPA: YceI family protein [Terriglobales bacterium]|nr:YceI family protein [Terriglobales bacterium]
MKKFLALAVLASASLCVAETQTWQIDPNHTASQFSVRHLGISTVRGQFMKTTGTVAYDPADVSKTQIDVTIDASSVDTRVQMRDNDLRSPHFLEVEKYPTITFKSKKAESAGQGKLKVTGDLTIHGVTKEVVLDVDGPSAPMSAMGGMRMGAEATTKINRKDFGVNGAPGAVGDDIQITLDVELTRPAK